MSGKKGAFKGPLLQGLLARSASLLRRTGGRFRMTFVLVVVFWNHFAFYITFPDGNASAFLDGVCFRNVTRTDFCVAFRNIANALFLVLLGNPPAMFDFDHLVDVFAAIDFVVAWLIAYAEAVAIACGMIFAGVFCTNDCAQKAHGQ
jgi:hypothetical protein